MCVLVDVHLRVDIAWNPAEVRLSHTPQFPFLLFGELQSGLQDRAQRPNFLLTLACFHFLLRIIFLLLAFYFLFEGLLLFSVQKTLRGEKVSTMIRETERESKPCGALNMEKIGFQFFGGKMWNAFIGDMHFVSLPNLFSDKKFGSWLLFQN